VRVQIQENSSVQDVLNGLKARTIPDHFINCPELYFEIEDVKLGKTQTEQYNLDTSKGSFRIIVERRGRKHSATISRSPIMETHSPGL